MVCNSIILKNFDLVSLLTILIFPYIICGQEVKREFKNEQFNNSDLIASDGEFIYMDFGSHLYFSAVPETQFLYKLDKSLNLIDSLNLTSLFLNPDSSGTLYFTDLEVDESGFIYTLCNLIYDPPSGGNCRIVKSLLARFNSSLKLLDTYFIDRDSLEESLSYLHIKDGVIILSGVGYKCGNSLKPLIARLNTKSNIIQFKLFQEFSNTKSLILTNPIQIEDKIISNVNLVISSNSQNHLSTLVLDTSFSILDTGSVLGKKSNINLTMIGAGAFIPVSSDSIWKLTSTMLQYIPNFDKYWVFGVSLLDTNFNVTSIDTFSLSGYDFNVPGSVQYAYLQASYDTYDYSTIDSVLYVQGSKYITYDNYSGKDSSSFYLYNFNARKGTMNWIKRIQRNYSAGEHSITALKNNRWAIAFNEYNWDKYTGENLAVHVWILNGNGDIISKKEWRKKEWLNLYPNPAHEFLQLEFREANWGKNEVYFQIYDILGKIVMEGYIKNQEPLDISKLSSGTYQIIVEDTNVSSFIKE